MALTPAIRDTVAKYLSKDPMAIFDRAFSEASDAAISHNDCIKAGWAAVKEAGWQAPSTGKKWVLVKDDPGGGDVHVLAPMGSKKPKKGEAGYCEDGAMDKFFKVEATNDALGLVFGWAIVCKGEDGKDYFDSQDDHIPEDTMLREAADFMQNSRMSKDMHVGDQDGAVVFAFPMTGDIAKSLKITTPQTGLLIAMKPSPDVYAKFASGEYTGFSIGGMRGEDEEVT